MSKIVRHLLHATSSGNDPWDNRFEPDYIWCDLDSAKDFRLEEESARSFKTNIFGRQGDI